MKPQVIKVQNKGIAESVAKMASDKASVRLFLKGKMSIEEMNERGINFAKPL